MTKFSLSSMIIFNKNDNSFDARGLTCEGNFDFIIPQKEIPILRNKISGVTGKYKNSENFDAGYVILYNFASQFLFYVNLRNRIVFLIINADDMKEVFMRFTEIVNEIRNLINKDTENKRLFKVFAEKFAPGNNSVNCRSCNTNHCIPKLTLNSEYSEILHVLK